MGNHDKIFDQFKNAAENVTPKKFDSMDNVWAKVENKLDQKVLKKENKFWKKIAVAASIFLVGTIGYQFFKTNQKIEIQNNPIVVNDSIMKKVLKPKAANEVIAEVEPIVVQKENPLTITEPSKKDNIQSDYATINEPSGNGASSPTPIVTEVYKSQEMVVEKPKVSIEKNDSEKNDLDMLAEKSQIAKEKANFEASRYKSEKDTKAKQLGDFKELKKARSGHFYKGKIFDAIGVHNENESKSDKPIKVSLNKNAPLLVIDGKAITSRSNSDKYDDKKAFSDLEDDEIETVVELKEPLYVINGVYYSEEELFGSNPTSPYAPLSKQEIETIVVLQEKDAVPVYGEKGRKGVVIVSTKNGKPLKK
jgi:hypothetical protein